MNKDSDMRHIKQPRTAKEVKGLRVGNIAGDAVGGKSFSDDVAQALEARGDGWYKIYAGPGTTAWTCIKIVR